MQLAIDIPKPIFDHLSRLAELTDRPLTQLVIQSITGNLPPSVDTAPVEMQTELLELQTLSVDELRKIAQSQISPSQQECHLTLLEGNQEGRLTETEKQELRELSLNADRLMLKKAHACAVLRWLGEPIHDLNQLSPH